MAIIVDRGDEGVQVLNDLLDVVLSTLSDGEYLRYNGSEWVNSAIQSGDLPTLDHGSLSGLGDDDHSQYISTSPTTDSRNTITGNAIGTDLLNLTLGGGIGTADTYFIRGRTSGGSEMFNFIYSPTSTPAMMFRIDGNIHIQDAKSLRLFEDDTNGTNYIGLKAPNSVTGNTTFTLPDGDGNPDQVLKTDGSGTLSWTDLPESIEELNDLIDVDADAPSDGDVLTYVGGSIAAWQPQAPSGSSGGIQVVTEFPASPDDGDAVIRSDLSYELYVYDSGNNAWLSTSETQLQWGRNITLDASGTASTNLRFGGDAIPFNTTAVVVRKDMVLVGTSIGLNSSNGTGEVRIRDAGTTIHTISFSSDNPVENDIFVDVPQTTALNVQVELTSGTWSTPTLIMYCRYKYDASGGGVGEGGGE